MSDLIALVCPSCGEQIQIEKNLEKIYCPKRVKVGEKSKKPALERAWVGGTPSF